MMGDRMAADRRELLGRQTADFAPIHEGLVEDRARTDPVTAAKLGGGGRLLVRRHGHEPAKEPIEGLALLGDRTGGSGGPPAQAIASDLATASSRTIHHGSAVRSMKPVAT